LVRDKKQFLQTRKNKNAILSMLSRPLEYLKEMKTFFEFGILQVISIPYFLLENVETEISENIF
jgi:hypothetical protein